MILEKPPLMVTDEEMILDLYLTDKTTALIDKASTNLWNGQWCI